MMAELQVGIIGSQNLHFVSLKFNKGDFLYSIKQEFYKETVVGDNLGMVDYYMKCFVKGGVFQDELMGKWEGTGNG
jgi:hypothetical protein